MSIITVWKQGNELIFSADSRFMKSDSSSVDSDAVRKLFEITLGTFMATSGRLCACEYQVATARKLADKLGTDIRVIGAALEQETLSFLPVLVERLRLEPDETTRQAASGEIMLHGCMLAGKSGGKLGYVRHEYRVRVDGTISCETEAYFEPQRKATCIAGTAARLMTEIAFRFQKDPATWRDPLEAVSARWLEAVKEVTPTIGGPWQVVRLEAAGAHWISQPPAADHASETAAGTCTATVSFTSPIITGGSLSIATSGGTVNISSITSGIDVTQSGITSHYGNNVATVGGSGGIASVLGAGSLVISYGGSPYAALAPTGLYIGALPSSSPGSKQFWYDPADGNRVKYTP